MRKSTTLEDRIRVRAYHIWLSYGTRSDVIEAASKMSMSLDVFCWVAAEATELELAGKRSAAAKKGARTRAIRQTATTAQMTERLRSEQSTAQH